MYFRRPLRWISH